MKKGLIALAVIVGLLIIFGGTCVGRYNSLVRAEETVDQSWAQVENVLQRRADLIPNLVETVKGFAAHEQQVFGDIAEARSKLLGATGPTQAAQANAQMESALGRLLAIAENYPDLKSNQNFIRLQDELAGTENRIAVERKRYNDAVAEFNKTIKTFPNNIVAGMLGFDAHAYFEVEEQAKEVPKVEF